MLWSWQGRRGIVKRETRKEELWVLKNMCADMWEGFPRTAIVC